MNLSEFVVKRRRQLGLSQRDVAAKSRGQISPVSVHDVESGRSVDIKASMILGLARGLSVKPQVIIEAIGESLTGAST